ncbi:TRAP transporter substrate-binding protein [Chloroflexota bacterium]
MKREKLLATLGGICLILVLAALSFVGACAKPAPTEVIELTFSHFTSAKSNTQVQIFEPWVKEIEERTNGGVKITIFAGQALSKAKDQFDHTMMGMSDIGFSCPQYTPGRFPLSCVSSMPAPGVINGYATARAISDIVYGFPEVMAEYEGVHFIGIFCTGPNLFHTKEAVRTMEDLKGMKIRSPGGPANRTLELLGAIPTAMPFPEIYNALERGVLDGCLLPSETVQPIALMEVTNYHTLGFSPSQTAFYVVMNQNTYNSLPRNIQKVFDDLSGDNFADFAGRAWTKFDGEGLDMIKAAGREVIILSPEEVARMREITKPSIAEWAASMNAKGLPGTKLADEFLRLVEKYSKEKL